MTVPWRPPGSAARLTVLFGAWLVLAPGIALGHEPAPIPNPPEPGVAELPRQAGLDGRDPAALLGHLDALLRGDTTHLDAWVPTLRRQEHQILVSAAVKLGYGELTDGRWAKALPAML